MIFHKKFQSKLNDLWYPRAITTGIPIVIGRIVGKLPLQSTVTRGDTYAALRSLGGVVVDYMASESTVKINGIGTFHYTVTTNKNGVVTPEEVTFGQINDVRVCLIPEVKRSGGKQITTRPMMNADVVWMGIKEPTNGGTPGGGPSNPGGSGSEGGEEQDPLG